MKTPLDFVRQALAESRKQLAIAKNFAERSYQDERRVSRYSGMQAAMLADVCEALFGDNSRGAPKILAYELSSWVCGPGTKTEETWLEEWAKGWKVEPTEDWSIRLGEWREFIAGLKVRK